MCTVISKNRQGKPQIAKEDIVVYKACDITGENTIISLACGFEYKKNLLYQDDFEYDADVDVYSDSEERRYGETLNKKIWVTYGFHSYLDMQRCYGWRDSSSICKFIVPKGAKYYKNGSRNIVSNQIIFKEIIK